MQKQFFSPLMPGLLVFFLLLCPTFFAQSPAPAPAKGPKPKSPPAPPPSPPAALTPAPSPSPPPSIVGLLKKLGRFSTFLRLLQRSQMDGQLESLVKSSYQFTVFVPPDLAFTPLQSDIESFSDKQRMQLIQYHVVNTLLNFQEFETVNNPLSTQAGQTKYHQFPLNVTIVGTNMYVSTGIVNATVTATLYSGNRVAVYQVDHVLLPYHICLSSPTACGTALDEAPSPAGAATAAGASSGAVRDVGRPVVAVALVCSDLAAFLFVFGLIWS
ncbi:hypothetical protein NMG60_11005495 [Bertholletia excelsa]